MEKLKKMFQFVHYNILVINYHPLPFSFFNKKKNRTKINKNLLFF